MLVTVCNVGQLCMCYWMYLFQSYWTGRLVALASFGRGAHSV